MNRARFLAVPLSARATLLAYAGAVVLFALTSLYSPGFAAPSHLRTLVVVSAFTGIVAVGQTLVIIGGGIDLSVPWVLNSAAILVTLIAGGSNAPLIWAMPLIVAGGALVGVINGFGIAWCGVPAIIMTLSTNTVLQGLLLLGTGGTPPAMTPHLLQTLATGRIGPIPIILLIWAGLAIAVTLLLGATALGRYLYALGSSRGVAEFSGVPIRAVSAATYVICGATSAFAGVLLTGYSGQAYLGMGDPFLFTSIAAVAIGGASILGGTGSYIGTIAGALVLTILTGLLPIFRLSNGALQVIYGVVILMTVSLAAPSVRYRLFRRRRQRL
jgi:ribose transport system permease protein